MELKDHDEDYREGYGLAVEHSFGNFAQQVAEGRLPSYYKGYEEASSKLTGGHSGRYPLTKLSVVLLRGDDGEILDSYVVEDDAAQDLVRGMSAVDGGGDYHEILSDGHTVITADDVASVVDAYRRDMLGDAPTVAGKFEQEWSDSRYEAHHADPDDVPVEADVVNWHDEADKATPEYYGFAPVEDVHLTEGEQVPVEIASVAGLCLARSSITDAPCVLPAGHDADTPFRFHRYDNRQDSPAGAGEDVEAFRG